MGVSPGSLTLIGSTCKRVCLPKDPESGMKTCWCLAVTSCNSNFKIPAQGLLLVKSSAVQCSSVAQLCPTLCDKMDCSTPGFPEVVLHQLPGLVKLTSIELVMPYKNLITFHPLFLLLLLLPRSKVFSKESILCIGWPKY